MCRILPVVCVCLFSVTLLAEPITYTFNVTSGSVGFEFSPPGLVTPNPVLSEAAGTFTIKIDQGLDGVNAGDGVQLVSAAVVNTEGMQWSLDSLATATLDAGNLLISDFDHRDMIPIGSGGASNADTAVFVEIDVLTTGGPISTPFSTVVWSEPGQMSLALSVPAGVSETLTLAMQGTFRLFADVNQSVTWDLIIDIEGTAHVVPDPSLAGLVTLGLAGAGGWLGRGRRG